MFPFYGECRGPCEIIPIGSNQSAKQRIWKLSETGDLLQNVGGKTKQVKKQNKTKQKKSAVSVNYNVIPVFGILVQ